MARIRIHTIQEITKNTRKKAHRMFEQRIHEDMMETDHDCLLWKTVADGGEGKFDNDGFPYMQVHAVDNIGRPIYTTQIGMTGYLWSYMLGHPMANPLSSKDIVMPTCGEALCVNPTHLKVFEDGPASHECMTTRLKLLGKL